MILRNSIAAIAAGFFFGVSAFVGAASTADDSAIDVGGIRGGYKVSVLQSKGDLR